MSDLKVWVDGKERVIRGVSEGTTCESVVLVLAKAAGKSGKVALLEKWRDFERILPRNENPLKCFEAWGTHKEDVCLVLQDDDVPTNTVRQIDFTKHSINPGIDNKCEVIKRSVDCEYLENFTALQERKLKSLSRASEILDYQLSCWDDDDEKFLYLTEDEIIEDFSLKLCQTVKLQGKELVELSALKTQLHETQKCHQKSASKFELYSVRILQMEYEVADTYDVVRKLLIQIENTEQEKVKVFDVSNEMPVLQLKLEEQKDLSLEQNKELQAIKISLSELSKAFQLKTNKIELLKNEIKPEEVFYDLDEHFRPLSPDEDPNFYRESLSGESVDRQLSRIRDNEAISEAVQDVKSGSKGSQVEDDTDYDLLRSSAGSPQEFFRNWSSSTRISSSPLNYYPIVNGMKGRNETDLQTSVKEENGINVSETSKNGKEEFPFFETRREISSEKFLRNDINFGTRASIGKEDIQHSRIQNIVYLEKSKNETQGSSASFQKGEMPSMSSFMVNSVMEIKLQKEMKQHSVDRTSSSVRCEKDEAKYYSEKLFKSSTKTKPLKNSFLTSGLPKVNSKFNVVSPEYKKIDTVPPATLPKPPRKSSSESQKHARTGALSLLSNPKRDTAYLLPPNVPHKRSQHRKERPKSHDDLYEEGVFV